MPCRTWALVLVALTQVFTASAPAAGTLHERIDELILAKANGKPAAAPADDAEFLRRVYLDFAGRIPAVQEARTFLQDQSPDKRARLIDQLLNGPEYPRRMQEMFHVVLMERLGDSPEWSKYLRDSFAANKPWDQLVREMLTGGPRDETTRGAGFFYAKRLENYGQNPVDYPALTRDVGRLFLGMDLQCAQCHDHRFVKEYKQQDFQGLFAIFLNTALNKGEVTEKLMTQKLAFNSVFNKVKKETGPRVPGRGEMEIPAFKKGEEFIQPPDPKKRTPGVPKFSPLTKLSEELPRPDTPTFSRNGVNRLWFLLMGRGIVHPLDLHHKDNPPSHPELLDLLAQEFIEHKFDVKWFFRELALSQTYQRSSLLPAGQDKLPPESFLVMNEKRLSAEQLMWSMLEAVGQGQSLREADAKAGKPAASPVEPVRQKFLKAFANPAREPEEEFNASLKAALFVLNDPTVLAWLEPKAGNLIERLDKLADADQVAEELYVAVLTRQPTPEEKAEVADYLKKNAQRKPVALGHLAWALLASTEFCVNH